MNIVNLGRRACRLLGSCVFIAALGLGLSVSIVIGSVLPAMGFGTINGKFPPVYGALQRGEHERITRAALACAPDVKSDGSCFEPKSIAALAGKNGALGAVGAPDTDEAAVSSAHCDDADFLNDAKYPFSPPAESARQQANTHFYECLARMRRLFGAGVSDAHDMLKPGGTPPLNLPELKTDQVDLSTACTFVPSARGRAKCNVIEDFGRMLHTAQDFYAHSNWTDVADSSQPISINNPPGLGRTAPSPLLDLRGTSLPEIPLDFTTGYYKGVDPLDHCPGTNNRVTHACLNKDDEFITARAGGTDATSLNNQSTVMVTDPLTRRGQVGNNAYDAVTGAIVETRHQWEEFRQEIIARYGDRTGKLLINALTQDVPKVDLVFVIDTTGSMGPYIDGVKTQASATVDKLTDPDHPVDYRIAVVDYKDLYSGCPSDGYASQVDLGFSTDKSAILAAINGLSASGGCDTPESVYSGLMSAINLPWRNGVSKAVIQLGDAPPHDPEPTTGFTATSVANAAIAVDPAAVYPIDINGGGGPLLAQIAERTGGRVFPVSSVAEATDAILHIIDNVSSTPVNNPPVAKAGPDQIVACSGLALTPVKLDGSQSSDPDGNTLTYVWAAPGITFDNAAIAMPTGTFPIGTTTATLTVSDGTITSTDSVQITVKPCIQINNGAAYTNTRTVQVALSYQGGPTSMRLSDESFKKESRHWPHWQPFTATTDFKLDWWDGKKTVYVQFKLPDGSVSDVFSDSITLDSSKPVVRSFQINHRQHSTANTKVQLTIQAYDRLSGVQLMRLSNSASDLSKAAWIPYSNALEWTLPSLGSTHPEWREVYIQLQDAAHNISRIYHTSIRLKP